MEKMNNEELHILHSSPNIIRQIKSTRLRWVGHVARMKGKRPLGRPRHRWEDGIRLDLRETGWGSIEWIQLAQDRDRWQALVIT
jgi:hypothetical protein